MKIILPKIKINIERWKWNEHYQMYVSNMGHFRNGQKREIKVKINQKGYCVIPHKQLSAHRIVMMTWKPVADMEALTIDHLNHNKRDNSIKNLEWVTKEENLRRAQEDYVVDIKEPTMKKLINHKIMCINTGVQFDNIDEAATWLIDNSSPGSFSNVNKEKVAKRLEEKVCTHCFTKYGNFCWKIV